MKGTLSELHRRGADVQRKGWTNNFLHFLIDSLWRDEIWVKKLIFLFVPLAQKQADWGQEDEEAPDYIKNKPEGTGTGEDGREIELSTSGGYIVWRYVGDTEWINLVLISSLIGPEGPQGPTGAPGANGRGITSIVLHSTVGLVKTYRITFSDATTFDFTVTDGEDGTGGGGEGGTVTVITEGENIEVYYDFKDAVPFTYTCPMALRFLEVEYENNAPALSVALNTDMAKYDDLTITPDGIGLVIVRGKVATAFNWPVYIDFEIAKAETYKCPYPIKFLAMEHEQANAPTLSVALNTNMAKYQVLTITADAPGLVSLIGILL